MELLKVSQPSAPKTLLRQSSMQSPDLRQSGHRSNRRDTASNLSQRSEALIPRVGGTGFLLFRYGSGVYNHLSLGVLYARSMQREERESVLSQLTARHQEKCCRDGYNYTLDLEILKRQDDTELQDGRDHPDTGDSNQQEKRALRHRSYVAHAATAAGWTHQHVQSREVCWRVTCQRELFSCLVKQHPTQSPRMDGGPFQLPSQQQPESRGARQAQDPHCKNRDSLVRKMGNGKNELRQQQNEDPARLIRELHIFPLHQKAAASYRLK
ncbi:hypothetical protein QYF61_026970, partial [Mycteria americana]